MEAGTRAQNPPSGPRRPEVTVNVLTDARIADGGTYAPG